ncbi:MAG: signal peptidase I [Acidobacteria bacterium]|nr:signal peptidase I [Acidobacteriota bacterium]
MPTRTSQKLVALIVVLFSITLIARLSVAEICRVPSRSMEPSLTPGDQVVVMRFHARDSPRRGEVVVFEDDEGRAWIKRVIGLPGDSVAVDGGRVTVNGTTLSEPYARKGGGHERSVHLVPAGHYFVLGDNRASSDDSRVWGFVTRESLRGRARVICWSRAEGGDVRWDRILTAIE